MEYPYLTILEIVVFIFTLLAAVIILYFLLKFLDKTTKFSAVLKTFLLYQLGAILVFLAYPYPLVFRVLSSFGIFLTGILKFLDLAVLTALLFLIFYFIAKKLPLIINWKKSLAIFLVMIFILFPFLNYSKLFLTQRITNLPIFEKEISKFNSLIGSRSLGELLFFGAPIPWSFRILTVMESGLSLPVNYLKELLILI
jgi:hypothetical protein